MNNRITITTLLIIIGISFGFSQQKIKEKDIIGQWKLVIEIEEALDEAREELDEEDNILGKVVLSSVSAFVEGILNNIDIYFDFQPNGKLAVKVDAFGEKEMEYSQWHIDNNGKLYIEDTEHFSSDDNDYWMLDDGILITSDNEDGKYVYMVRLDD